MCYGPPRIRNSERFCVVRDLRRSSTTSSSFFIHDVILIHDFIHSNDVIVIHDVILILMRLRSPLVNKI